ncbi:alanine racemase [Sandarakinorhabdus sp. AAP62]|uniref:alanine racemase n=1 Tax=Sandarakinorhabdus sp. AAP62 TaxID=1248916 RepID=UPI0002FDAB4A|nr:alanine racemase [Sandarakinorhabdus sp. AAP62]
MQSLPDFLARVKPPITPALVVRRAVMMANLAAMQAACAERGVRLRAHGKMHKCSALGRLQIEMGAVGLCCQTVGEAETYVHAGIGDVLVTAPVPAWGWLRLAALARTARVGAVMDSAAQIAEAATAALAAGVVLDAHVDVDPGMARAGVAPAGAVALAAAIAGQKGLRYAGIQAYCGHHQHLSPAERAAAHAEWTARLVTVVAELRAAGLAPEQITGGGTGTAAMDLAAGVYTELQPGSYAVMDVEYGDLGDLPFAPALFLAASVVSANHASHVTCDAGHKALHPNGPMSRVVQPAGSVYKPMGDEHGAIVPPSGVGEGDLVWLQPGHVDPTVALHDAFFVAEEDGRLERWPIDARRASL